MDRVFPIVISIAVTGMVARLVVQRFRRAKREQQSQSWPSTEATIQSAEMVTIEGRGGSTPVLCGAFSYVVNGEYYSGKFSIWECDDLSAAFVREMIGKKLNVHYDPIKPSSYSIRDELIEGCPIGLLQD
jgi:hypothetical protein